MENLLKTIDIKKIIIYFYLQGFFNYCLIIIYFREDRYSSYWASIVYGE